MTNLVKSTSVPLHSLSQLSRPRSLATASQGSEERRERHRVGLDAVALHVLTCCKKSKKKAVVWKKSSSYITNEKTRLWFVAILVNLQIIGGLSLGKKLRETTMASTPKNLGK